jgi:hypothetical protein
MKIWKVELSFAEVEKISTEEAIKSHDKSEIIGNNLMM